ncbi:MAG: prepilin-type N-terminal cleavage/methylation domain-containing protein [Candidatus Eisenbacteria bacterium]|nr:prepilin-type N-terminal cleavage/methylation domain-containing protein [Candidatus Latescibacterota bacterium]MBD3302689.1 prepilin-type N-terminal cleavage/methylation domain-containing protein [Candidatus Eisenbacteria bacterium]
MRRFRRPQGKKGFTMIELMVVVVVVGVLAAIAVPIYGKYIKNARVSEATARIGEILTACKAYAQEHQSTSGNPTWPPSRGGGIVDLSDSDLFSYSITSGAGGNANSTALNIRATGRSGRKMAGVRIDVRCPNINANADPPDVSGL